MDIGNTIAKACSSFAVTNIDNIFVLVTFFAESSSDNALTPVKIIIGQYAGFTVLVILSVAGFAASMAVPSEPIGFLGLLPVLLGLWKALGLLFPRNVEEKVETDRVAGFNSIFKVATITVVNGGDNVGTYIPLFAQAKWPLIAVYIAVYYILLAVWCAIAWLVMRQKHFLRVIQKYLKVLISLLYSGLGIFILINSECYPWSVEHIDAGISSKPGIAIVAVMTVVVVLFSTAIMIGFKLRKGKTQNDSNNPVLHAEERSSSDNFAPTENQHASPAETLCELPSCARCPADVELAIPPKLCKT